MAAGGACSPSGTFSRPARQPSARPVVQTDMPRPSPQSAEARETLLLQRVAERDRQAFEELYNAYHRRLSRFLMRLAPRYDFAEEIINDTFWVVWRKAGEFRGASRVSANRLARSGADWKRHAPPASTSWTPRSA